MAEIITEKQERVARAICRFNRRADDWDRDKGEAVRNDPAVCRKNGTPCLIGSPCVWWQGNVEQARGAIAAAET